MALYRRRAVNQAATLWSRGLLAALREAGCELRVCSHCREQYWPQGELWPGGAEDFDASAPVRRVGYANVPLLRDRWLTAAYRRAVTEELRTCRPDYVLGYNFAPYYRSASDILAQAGVKWVPIVLDQDDPEPDNWATFTCQARGVSGLIFLSHWGYRHCPLQVPTFHLDGGADAWRGGGASCGTTEVVYSGKYDDRYGGLDMLFETFAAVKTPNCVFRLTGKDPKKRLAKYLRRESRAVYSGFVDEAALGAIQSHASVFVNPRPPGVSDNRMTFPSKLLQYLSYGKPVVSSWTDGLSPEYRNLLLVPDVSRPEAYAALIDQALAFTEERRARLSQTIRLWLESTHTWAVQAQRVLEWLTGRVGS